MGEAAKTGGKAPEQKVEPTSRIVRLRKSLQGSQWYHSRTAIVIRRTLRSSRFVSMMGVWLLVALFFVDIWAAVGVNSNVLPNIVLTLVMLVFTVECVGLSSVEASYLLSFFFLMDVFGTVSMIFDIPWLAGVDATQPQQSSSSDDDAKRNLMLLRALRATKIAARAGRLSRVVRFLRFLPFMGGEQRDEDEQVGIASLISGQLSTLLASRVAALTLVLVMAIPLLDVWTFPQTDYSMRTWTDRLSSNLAEGRMSETIRELDLMSEFYSQFPYGPYLACIGSINDDVFQCSAGGADAFSSWHPKLEGPSRMASALQVHTETFMVGFNMQEPVTRQAGIAMGSVGFVMAIMVFSGLALSSTVNQLAVRPLERMLATVRQIATTAFKISAEVVDEDEKGEDVIDIDNASEMNLLEKVVQKLAIITQLQTSDAMPQATEDLRDEDIGVLSMMRGKDIASERRPPAQDEGLKLATGYLERNMSTKSQPVVMKLEDLDISEESFYSWAFNPLGLSPDQHLRVAKFMFASFREQECVRLQMPQDETLHCFLEAVQSGYQPREKVPFHNFSHAVDVMHAVSRVLRNTHSNEFISELEQYSLLVAAIAHDVGHFGLNNGFLSEVGHELALQYNDRSPLENMHCAQLYTILGDPQANVFAGLTKEERREVRNICIEAILHTDMMLHGAMVKELQVLFEMNLEVLEGRTFENGVSEGEIGLFNGKDTKPLVLNSFLHMCDVANPCKAWDATQAWAEACLEEFFRQGDQEKERGIPVQFLNDRDKLNRPNSQIGFIEFMISPLVTAMVHLWPTLFDLHENLSFNLETWRDLWVKDASPSDEEKQKVDVRVLKVKNSL